MEGPAVSSTSTQFDRKPRLFIRSVPGFPVRGVREGSVCGFLYGKPHGVRGATNLDRKSGSGHVLGEVALDFGVLLFR